MPDIREVAERVRGKRTWSVREVRAAVPKMRPELIEQAFFRRYGSAASSVVGPTGWHRVPHARSTHWFLRGWAICGWGSTGTEFGREDEHECPACRREIERAKVA